MADCHRANREAGRALAWQALRLGERGEQWERSCTERVRAQRLKGDKMEELEGSMHGNVSAMRLERDSAIGALTAQRIAFERRRAEQRAVAVAECNALREILRAMREQLSTARGGEKRIAELCAERDVAISRRSELTLRRRDRRKAHESEVVNLRDIIRAMSAELEEAGIERSILKAELEQSI